ncbi:MAG: hypothetical protein AAB426_11250 [Myxococcota bacterium]
MSPRALSAVLLLAASVPSCLPHLRRAPPRPPRGESAEVFVYVEPFPSTAARLQVSLNAVGLVYADGTEATLELERREVGAATDPVLLAWGRVPAGSCQALRVGVRRAVLTSPSGPADLLVPVEPVTTPLPTALTPGGAAIFSLALAEPGALTATVELPALWHARRVDSRMPEMVTYASVADAAMIVAIDRRYGQVVDAIATGRGPRGVAIDRIERRAYVTLADEDATSVIDLAAGREYKRLYGYPGDEPTAVDWLANHGVLLIANAGSNTLSFVRPEMETEVARVATGERPVSIAVDREGRRAYVLNELSSSITIVDIANMAVVGSTRTEARPVRAQVDRTGRELVVLAAGSPDLVVYELPSMRPVRRVYVGLGARALRLDPTTDALWVAMGDEPKLVMFAAHAMLPSVSVPLPAVAGYLAIDDVENRLWATLPEGHAVAVVDLVSRRVLHVAEIGAAASFLSLIGERR